MNLKYKITLSILFVSLSILGVISYVYSELSFTSIMKHEKKNLTDNSVEYAEHIKKDLLDKLSNALTIVSAPIVFNALEKSNTTYNKLKNNDREQYINKLNTRWKQAENDEDEFVQSHLSNSLALYLKKQQRTLPGVYGELFITNKYGVMIASTGKLTTLSHAHKYWWKESYSKGSGEIFFDDRGFDSSVNGYVIGIVVPIKKDNKIIGILKANINITNTLKNTINAYKDLNHGSLKIVRTKGLIVYEYGTVPLSTRVNNQLLKKLENKETGTIVLKDGEKNFLTSYSPMHLQFNEQNVKFGGKPTTLGSSKGNENEIWNAIISYDQDLALADNTNKIIIYIGLIITFISSITAFLIGSWISKPIEELSIAKEKLLLQEKILISQSRHVAMGEMISMIAHQWRQPMSTISMGINNILIDIALGNVDEKIIEKSANDILQQIDHLSKTIDDFRNFFDHDKEKDLVNVNDVIDESLEVIGKSLQNNNIELEKHYNSQEKIFIYSRELLQVLINIFKNAKEALLENETKNALITVSTTEDKNNVSILICNNGKNINNDIITHIFEPYFTTKDEFNGTGLGLYMSKVIVDKHLDGSINVSNQKNGGVCFNINLSKQKGTDSK